MPPSVQGKIYKVCRLLVGQATLDLCKGISYFGIRSFLTKVRTIRAQESQAKKDPPPYYISICAILKDEGPYIKEWVEYHRLLGVEKFYLYDNGSTDDSAQKIQELKASGINIEYIRFPGERMQLPAYEHCRKLAMYETKWLAIIDLDEFIQPGPNTSLIKILKKSDGKYSQLLMPWMFFGSSGRISTPTGLVIESYTRRAKQCHSSTKAIVNPRRMLTVAVHRHTMLGQSKFLTDRILRLNHYHCKSWEEYQFRATRGDVAGGQLAALQKYQRQKFDSHDCNDVFDDSVCRYAAQLKKILSSDPTAS